MVNLRLAGRRAALVLACLAVTATWAAETVTVDNFVRAETDMTMKRYVSQGAFGKLPHSWGTAGVSR